MFVEDLLRESRPWVGLSLSMYITLVPLKSTLTSEEIDHVALLRTVSVLEKPRI